MSRFTIHPSMFERQNGRLVKNAHGPGDQGKDWFTSVTELMDAHPELYPTARDALQQLGAEYDTMTAIEIAQWRAHHRFPFPITRAAATAATGAPDPTAVRAWAREHGYDVASRGVLRRDVINAYLASTQET